MAKRVAGKRGRRPVDDANGTGRPADVDVLQSLVTEMLLALGENPGRNGLLKTPERVAKALAFMTQGYQRRHPLLGELQVRLRQGELQRIELGIGIAADDTIHFLTAYARERRSGKDAVSSLRDAISGVGEAVIATSTALALGFLSMMASPMASVADMGLLCAVAIIGATVADLIMLPALITTVAGWRRFQILPQQHG